MPNKKEKKGPIKPGKEKEKEEDKLELFFYKSYEFLNPIPAANVFVPFLLLHRHTIDFVPATSSSPLVVSSPVASAVSLTDYSVASSVNFVPTHVPINHCMTTR